MAISTPTYYTLKYLRDITHVSVLRCTIYIQVVYFFWWFRTILSTQWQQSILGRSDVSRGGALRRRLLCLMSPWGSHIKCTRPLNPAMRTTTPFSANYRSRDNEKLLKMLLLTEVLRCVIMWLLQFLLNQSKYIIFCGHLPSSHAFCGVLDHTRRLPECRGIVNFPQHLKWHRRRLRSAPPRETSLRPRMDCYH